MNYQRFTKGLFAAFSLLTLTLTQTAFAFAATAENGDAPSVIIYDNGPFQTGATSKSGVAAPAGAQWSEVQNFAGDLTSSNTSAGSSCNQSGFRIADNFVVPVGETWTINSVITFAYLTGGGTTTPFTAGTLRIWNGRPGDANSTVIFGDLTTNRLGSSTDTNTFRIFNTVAPAPGSAPGSTRRIWQNTLTVAPAQVLSAGNYWVEWATTVNNNAATAHFCPSTTILNTRYTPIMNGRQFNVATNAWVDAVDTGNPDATSADLIQDFPFKLDGTRTGARPNAYSRKVDFNGDNLTDYALTRTNGAAKNWFISQNGSGAASGATFGNATDVNVPEDYDGDGRTDIAVWRAAAFANYYILQSSTNTIRTEQFGQTGDDPTIVGDYDGDGKADPAVYRAATGNGTSTFFYRASTAAAGNITGIPFGAAGDKPYPGDFDGDRRFDAAVVRNNGGNAQHFQLRTTQGFVSVNYGLFADRFVTGDFDGDSRNDLIAVRASGANLIWFVQTSTTNQLYAINYGTTGDEPAPGDYDGDNRTDVGIFRNGTFFNFGSLSAPRAVQFGAAGDSAAAAYQVH